VAESLPHSNALLTAIVSAGGSEDYDASAAAGSSKWTGSAEAYFTEQRERSYAAGQADVILRRSLIIPGDLASELDLLEGDTLTVRFRGDNLSLRVRMIERREPPPGAHPATIRLTLEEG
jgi:hypothetical protein